MRDGGSGLHPGPVKPGDHPNPTYPPHMNNSWRFFKHQGPSTVILAGKMGFRRCGMDYQKEPALSMVYLLASLYVFLFIIIRHRITICFRSRLCKRPGYRMIFGLQTYRLQSQIMSCSRSSYPSQRFFKTPRSPSVTQKPAKMLPLCSVISHRLQSYWLVLKYGVSLMCCCRS